MRARAVIVLNRVGGLGDVAMVLAAAKAIKLLRVAAVVLVTHPRHAALARACPYVDAVVSSPEEARGLAGDPLLGREALPEAWAQLSSFDLNSAGFGLSAAHQVDAYLQALGLQAPPVLKQLHLELPDAVQARLRDLADPRDDARRVLLHAGLGDPNRTWPAASWHALAEGLAAAGWRPCWIGSRSSDPQRGVHTLRTAGVQDLVDALEPLEVVALCRRSRLLVSTDGGPVQLAGASDIGIVGLYSVVRGTCRLPFRHAAAAWNATALEAACPRFPCYAHILDPEAVARFEGAHGLPSADIPTRFSRWCEVEPPYRCMECLAPERVLQACLERLA